MIGGLVGISVFFVHLIVKFGVTITKHAFITDGFSYKISDMYYPRYLRGNKRVISDATGTFHLSAVYTNQNDNWAYFDSIRQILLADTPEPFHRSLVLGGCGCAVPITLARDYPNTDIDVVEKYRKMIEIAKTYFLKRNYSNRIHLIQRDGTVFIEHTTKQYDFIFIDIFDDTRIPDSLKTASFIQSLHKSVTQKGLIIINLGSNEKDNIFQLIALYRTFFPKFKLHMFGKTLIGIISNNKNVSYPGLRVV
jgi:spermidine synthase